MSQPSPSLWWAYDESNGSFSALPATPLIVPAALILGVVSALRWIFNPPRTREQIVGPIARTAYYQQADLRYHELIKKHVDTGDLEIHEWKEYYDLEFYLNSPCRYLK